MNMVWLDDLVRDIRFGLRQFSGNPVFAMVAILSLGVAIGANTSVFSLLNAVALRRLPVPHSERLVEVDAPDSQNVRQRSPMRRSAHCAPASPCSPAFRAGCCRS